LLKQMREVAGELFDGERLEEVCVVFKPAF
jgi:hypothetical protein